MGGATFSSPAPTADTVSSAKPDATGVLGQPGRVVAGADMSVPGVPSTDLVDVRERQRGHQHRQGLLCPSAEPVAHPVGNVTQKGTGVAVSPSMTRAPPPEPDRLAHLREQSWQAIANRPVRSAERLAGPVSRHAAPKSESLNADSAASNPRPAGPPWDRRPRSARRRHTRRRQTPTPSRGTHRTA
jgi:hypothetical protein